MNTKQPTRFDFNLDLKPAKGYPRGFYAVRNPLYVFKKVFTRSGRRAIANLIIPVGAVIYIHELSSRWNDVKSIDHKYSLKLRATEAYVDSIVSYVNIGHYWNFKEGDYRKVTTGQSWWAPSYQYRVGTTVRPTKPFLLYQQECGEGIHFFLNLQSAKDFN